MKKWLIPLFVILVLWINACKDTDKSKPFQDQSTPQQMDSYVEMEDTIPIFKPSFEKNPCPFTPSADQMEGESLNCGFVTVPEDHTNPAGPVIRLAVAIFKSKDQPGNPDPLFFLSGGPGEKTIAQVAPLAAHLAILNTDRDLVFFDQRGVGQSEPALECPELVRATFDNLDQPDPEVTQKAIFDAALSCKDRLLKEGINLKAFTTTQNAADVDAIRQALGYAQVNLLGGSYGALLSQAVMRNHPEHIRSVVLDSTIPMQKSLLIDTPTTAVNATLHLLDRCRADEACNQAYPDLENLLYQSIENLNENPQAVTLINPLDGAQYQALLTGDIIFNNLVFTLYQTPIIPSLPQAIYNLSGGDLDLMIQLSSRKLASMDALSRGMYLSVLCTDDLLGRTPSEYQEIRSRLPAAFAGHTDPEDIIQYGFFGICAKWPVMKADPSIRAPLKSDIPTLILAGEFDPVTPPEYGHTVSRHLPNSFFFEFPSIGHSVTISDECARSMVSRFLDDPTKPPQDTCRKDLSMTFTLPINLNDIPMEEVKIQEFGIRTLVPSAWIQVIPEYYLSPDQTIELVIKENAEEDKELFLSKWGATTWVADMEANGLDWQIHQVNLPSHNVAGYVATAGSERGFYMVLVITKPSKFEPLYHSIVLPIIDSITVSESWE